MVNKILGKMEVTKGFIQIPAKSREELIGDRVTPFETFVNKEPARIDNYGRLWSPWLKGRFSVGSCLRIMKTENGYFVEPIIGICENKARHTHIKSKPYFQSGSIVIYNDDILGVNAIEDDSVDLIVTSPPYDVDIKYENYNDNIPYNEYLEFTRKWLTRCYNFAKDDGRLCLNIPLDKNKGGQQSVCADITTIAKEIGWKYHSTIIWNEQNISRRTAWGSWMSASAPFVIAPVEVIVILYKKKWKKMHRGKSDITRDEFIEWTNGVWNFSGESRNRIGHPAPFPVELPKRCIKLFSFVGETVLDPFLGSGSTLIACLETNRAGIGVEINRNYCKLAKNRLEKHEIYQQKLL
jgi:site-specific DNA-methyltransferase (adenine-specific)